MGRYIAISGYGWSGSSALVDYFREFSRVYVPNVEFRLIRDPYGLDSLRTTLVEKWDLINSFNSIDDFQWLCEQLAKDYRRFQFGVGYSSCLDLDFLELANKFIESLLEYDYVTDSYFVAMKQNRVEYVVNKISAKLSRSSNSSRPMKRVGFSAPTYQEFNSKARRFIDSLFQQQLDDGMVVVLDQGISPLHPETLDMLDQAKMIIVDRDPCDIYADLIRSGGLIGSDLAMTRDVEKYIAWHNALRRKSHNESGILEIKFEDLVLNYEETTQKVLDFVGWDLGEHEKKRCCFNPANSKCNIGISKAECTPDERVAIESDCII